MRYDRFDRCPDGGSRRTILPASMESAKTLDYDTPGGRCMVDVFVLQ